MLGSHELQRNQSQDALIVGGRSSNYDDSYVAQHGMKKMRGQSLTKDDSKARMHGTDYSQTVLTSDSQVVIRRSRKHTLNQD